MSSIITLDNPIIAPREPAQLITNERGLVEIPEFKFVNTNEYTKSAEHFKKFGCYTKAHPLYDKLDFDAYWDEEERRCKEGYAVGGVRITGEHYTYLNYTQIRLTEYDKEKFQLTENILKNVTQSATKTTNFPDFWDGDYYYFHTVELCRRIGKHLCVGKARRKGYSYKNACIANHRLNFIPRSVTLLGAFDSGVLYPEGTMQMVVECRDFFNEHTDWAKRYELKDAEDHIKAGYTLRGESTERGYKSQVMALSFFNRPGAARGKDATLVLFEEAGMFPNLEEAVIATDRTLRDGIFVTGILIVFGTGGGENNQWAPFEKIYYNPDSYNMITFDNVWDEGARGQSVGYFIPTYQNKPGFMDKDGNSMNKEAEAFEDKVREDKKANSPDPKTVDRYIAEEPKCPREAFSIANDNIFPTAKISDQLFKVRNNPDMKYLARHGMLVRDAGRVILRTNEEISANGGKIHFPIKKFPLKLGSDVYGCTTEWEPPFKDITGRVPKYLYQIWHDPYGTDKDTKFLTIRDSLATAYVYQRTNNFTPSRGNRIVGSWVGRPNTMDEYNEQLFLLAERYNAEILFENNRGDVYGYAKRNQLLEYLADEPEMLWLREIANKMGRNKGLHINDKLKATGAIYLRDMLTEVIGHNATTGQTVIFLDYIYDEALLEELLKWNSKGNFDRVSALIVGMFHIKERQNTDITNETSVPTDDFFNRELFK